MEQNDRLEKNKDFFQGKELFNTKLLPSQVLQFVFLLNIMMQF